MDRYTPRKFRPFAIASIMVNGLIGLIEYWPFIFICIVFISPIKPYIRTQYEYYSIGSHKIMVECDYLSVNGFIKYTKGSDCPLVIVLNTANLNR